MLLVVSELVVEPKSDPMCSQDIKVMLMQEKVEDLSMNLVGDRQVAFLSQVETVAPLMTPHLYSIVTREHTVLQSIFHLLHFIFTYFLPSLLLLFLHFMHIVHFQSKFPIGLL